MIIWCVNVLSLIKLNTTKTYWINIDDRHAAWSFAFKAISVDVVRWKPQIYAARPNGSLGICRKFACRCRGSLQICIFARESLARIHYIFNSWDHFSVAFLSLLQNDFKLLIKINSCEKNIDSRGLKREEAWASVSTTLIEVAVYCKLKTSGESLNLMKPAR